METKPRTTQGGFPSKKVIRVAKPFFTSEKRWKARGYLALILVLMFTQNWLGAYSVQTQGQFMTAVENRNMTGYLEYLALWAGLAIVLQPLASTFFNMFKTSLQIMARDWTSTYILFHGYFANFAWYKMLARKDIDNPDQRMTAETDSFWNSLIGLSMSVADSFTQVCMYSYVLWTLMPNLPTEVFGATMATSLVVFILGKLLMPILVFICAMIGNVVTLRVGRELPNINNELSESEASLRFNLAETRREAETVAFAHGESIAELQARQGLKRVIDTLIRMMYLFRNLQLFTTPYNALVAIIPMALVSYMFMQGMVPLGTIYAMTAAFNAVYNGLTLLVGQFGGVMGFVNTTNRVDGVMTAFEEAAAPPPRDGKHIDVVEGPTVKADRLTISTPDGERDLIVDVSFEFKKGARVLVTGAHGVGKTALLRVAAGFWSRGTGKMYRPPFAKMMFLTASPYFPPMTLRQALCYPCIETCGDDAKFQAALNMAQLADLSKRAGGFDTVQTWRELLNPSEQQRLSFARVMMQKPEHVFIDEGTNSLEEQVELQFYQLLFGLGSTVVTAGPPAMSKYADVVLEIGKDGRCKLFKADEYKPTEDQSPKDDNKPESET
jgi:vitamin B12/bleomycin/antimicrobial peptide transport system ATP-binding/permease protein